MILTENINQNGWQKSGNFNKKNSRWGGDLERIVEYKNINNVKISEVKLLGYGGNETSIMLQIHKKHYKDVLHFISQNQFPKLKDDVISIYKLNIPNTEYLSRFLDTLAKIEPSIAMISSELVDTFKPYSKEEPTIQGWNKHGCFGDTFSSGASLIRSETYHQAGPKPIISELSLLGYHDDTVRLSLNFDKAEFDKITNQLAQHGFNEPEEIDKILKSGFHIVDIADKSALTKCLNLLCTIDPAIQDIRKMLEKAYDSKNNMMKMDLEVPDLELGDNEDFCENLENILMQIQLAQLISEIKQQIAGLETKVSQNKSSLFANSSKQSEAAAEEKLISDEEMANSSFGQSCYSAPR